MSRLLKEDADGVLKEDGDGLLLDEVSTAKPLIWFYGAAALMLLKAIVLLWPVLSEITRYITYRTN